ncbi:hypothetical protein PO909_024990, partial [Leuciscus waleckii]
SSGFLSLILCDSSEYILIREYKTWHEAQDYCRQNYIDLATVQTDEEWSELNELRAELQVSSWVGLYDDVNSWRWSFRDENVTFTKWAFAEPDNYGGTQYCAILHSNGYWRDKDCNIKCRIICQSKGQPVLVSDLTMSWKAAQSYCRANYSDLFTVKNWDENLQLTEMIQQYPCAWIGLFRDSWKWSDQTSLDSPLPWADGQPDNLFGSEICGAVDDGAQVTDERCSQQLFFFCSVRPKQQVLRLAVKAGDDVNDQAITADVLKELVYGEDLSNLISAAMKQRLIHLFLLSGFLSLILCGTREYILIREYKTWHEAQDYCRQNYIDLATVQTDEEWSELNKLRAERQFFSWVGLYDDADSWRWSFRDENVTYLNWDSDQPNNLHGRQYCVNLRSTGYWWDEACNWTMPFFCQNGEGQPVLVTDPLLSWKEAQSYCRKSYSDLFTVKNWDENLQLTEMIQQYTCAWIGLFRDSWKWLNQTSLGSPLPWADGQPDNSFGADMCGAVDDYGHTDDQTCSTSNFFLCQTTRVKQQILRLEVKAGDNVNDQAITADVLNKVQQSLRAQGIAADVKITWREHPDGRIFQKMKNGSTGMNEEL